VVRIFFSFLFFSLAALGADLSDPPLLLRPIPEAPAAVAAPPSDNAINTSTTSVEGTPKDRGWEFNFGTGLAYFSGNYNTYANPGTTGGIVGFGLTRALTADQVWYAGLDAGLLFWTPSARTPGVQINSLGIQLLPTVFFRTPAPNLPLWVQLGVSMGPHFYVEQASGLPSHAGVIAEILLRPGIETRLSSDFSLELETKLGILGSSFIFLPQMGANLLL
jgi:hypothetical protein